VLAQHHRRLVAAVIDQRIVQPAEARARIERDEGKAVAFDQVDDDVGLPAAIIVLHVRHPPGLFLHLRVLSIRATSYHAQVEGPASLTVAGCIRPPWPRSPWETGALPAPAAPPRRRRPG